MPMSPDPFFQLDSAYTGNMLENHCRNCPQTHGGFCGVRISPDCLRIDLQGLVRASLSVTARTWFDMLAQLSEVLHLTRNSVAVMGALGRIPALEDWRNPVLPRDRHGLFTPNLAEYASLWVVREPSSFGVLHGLESRDVSGEVFQRALLPIGTRREVFEQFVTSYQSPSEETQAWFAPNQAWSAYRRAKLNGRIPWLRVQREKNSPNVRELPVDFLAKLFASAAQYNFPIRTAHYHPALIRSAIWTPRVCESAPKANNMLDFFSGDGVELYLHRPAIAGVWLWTGKCACCADWRWNVEVADVRGQPGLGIIAGDSTAETGWRNLLHSCLT